VLVLGAGASAATSDPERVVRAFYDAVNAGDYATAWELGGKNLGRSYDAFAQGFADTAHDAVTVLAVRGSTVSIVLVATHTDGRRSVYRATYTVQDGEIVAGHARLVARAGPAGQGGCDPAYPDTCLLDGIGDYDCAAGGGDGPNYVDGPLRVLPPDPFRLDRDGDGFGCTA
jgi:hypothetical protein